MFEYLTASLSSRMSRTDAVRRDLYRSIRGALCHGDPQCTGVRALSFSRNHRQIRFTSNGVQRRESGIVDVKGKNDVECEYLG